MRPYGSYSRTGKSRSTAPDDSAAWRQARSFSAVLTNATSAFWARSSARYSSRSKLIWSLRFQAHQRDLRIRAGVQPPSKVRQIVGKAQAIPHDIARGSSQQCGERSLYTSPSLHGFLPWNADQSFQNRNYVGRKRVLRSRPWRIHPAAAADSYWHGCGSAAARRNNSLVTDNPYKCAWRRGPGS